MTAQPILRDRRRQSRKSFLGRMEDITYSVLRKHGNPASKCHEEWDAQEKAVIANDCHAPRTV